jgi:hypothetical protein
MIGQTRFCNKIVFCFSSLCPLCALWLESPWPLHLHLCVLCKNGGGRGIRTPMRVEARRISSPLPYQLGLALHTFFRSASSEHPPLPCWFRIQPPPPFVNLLIQTYQNLGTYHAYLSRARQQAATSRLLLPTNRQPISLSSSKKSSPAYLGFPNLNALCHICANFVRRNRIDLSSIASSSLLRRG